MSRVNDARIRVANLVDQLKELRDYEALAAILAFYEQAGHGVRQGLKQRLPDIDARIAAAKTPCDLCNDQLMIKRHGAYMACPRCTK